MGCLLSAQNLEEFLEKMEARNGVTGYRKTHAELLAKSEQTAQVKTLLHFSRRNKGQNKMESKMRHPVQEQNKGTCVMDEDGVYAYRVYVCHAV